MAGVLECSIHAAHRKREVIGRDGAGRKGFAAFAVLYDDSEVEWYATNELLKEMK